MLVFSAASVSLADPAPFPFVCSLSVDPVDKLCYAGHIVGGGMFYDDGLMVTADTEFTVSDRLGIETGAYENLSLELDVIYENSENTGTVREKIKMYEFGDLKAGKSYPLFSETTLKNLKQRKKLYSSDVMSVKMIMNYQSPGGTTQKKQVMLLYVAKDDEYSDKLVSIAAPPQ